MLIDGALVLRFSDLFRSGRSAHGRSNITGETRSDKKIHAISSWVKEAVTLNTFMAHLQGQVGLGLCPILDDADADGFRRMCYWGAADLDIYEDFDHARLVGKLEANGAPVTVTKSKSGGAHVWLFASEPIEARVMNAALTKILQEAGYTCKEIFPKQDTVAEGKFGNWINLCYFGDTRQAVNPDGGVCALDEFLRLAELGRQPAKWFTDFVVAAPERSLSRQKSRQDVAVSVIDMSADAGAGTQFMTLPSVGITRAMLRFIPAEEYALWVEICLALRSALPDHARDLFHSYSKKSPKYDAAAADAKFNDCEPNGAYSYGTIVHHAVMNKWKSPARILPAVIPSSGVDPYVELLGHALRLRLVGHAESEILAAIQLVNTARSCGLTDLECAQIAKDAALEANVHELPAMDKGEEFPTVAYAASLLDEGHTASEVRDLIPSVEKRRTGESALTAGQVLDAVAEAAALPREVPRSGTSKGLDYIRDAKGKLTPCFLNAYVAIFASHEWDALHYDEFRQKICFGDEPWTSNKTRGVMLWLQSKGVMVGKDITDDAVEYVASKRVKHPLRDYLNSLTWDGVYRLSGWLHEYCAVPNRDEDRMYVCMVARKFLLQLIARALAPGVKADCMLIMVGAQGEGKSRAMFALMHDPRWFCDSLPAMSSKDSFIQLQGKWLIEIAEMDKMHDADVATVKRFLSSPNDTYRIPYDRHAVDMPRTTVFAGTTNEEFSLRDITGNRRLWPVRVQGAINVDGIAAARDQLFAEALHVYRGGERDAEWWPTKTEQIAASREQEAHTQRDVWYDDIVAWAENPRAMGLDGLHLTGDTPVLRSTRDFLVVSEALIWAVHKPLSTQKKQDADRVIGVLRSLKWTPCPNQKMIAGMRVRGWERPIEERERKVA